MTEVREMTAEMVAQIRRFNRTVTERIGVLNEHFREPVGCGALIFCPDAVGLVKRMWVVPSVRGLGLGRRPLYELEGRARARGVRLLRLETKNELSEAIRMYESSGYREVEPFNDEPYADH